MQEFDVRSVRPNKTSRPGRRTGVVRLISTNPLALPELIRLARPSRMPCRPYYLKLSMLAAADDIRVPRAAVIVLDAFSTSPVTEKVVAAIRAQHPRACVIVIVTALGDAQGFALLRLGVRGIVSDRDMAASLAKTITFVSAGGVRMPRGLMARFLSTFSPAAPVPPDRLSQRERQVLDCVVRSRSNKEIADDLNISESTVKFHLARIFRKFGVRRRAELIVQSTQNPAALVH
jgi:DNA-binding NarL/FixJ family response regulator